MLAKDISISHSLLKFFLSLSLSYTHTHPIQVVLSSVVNMKTNIQI